MVVMEADTKSVSQSCISLQCRTRHRFLTTHLDETVRHDEDGAAPNRPRGRAAGREPLLVEDLTGGWLRRAW